jgi:hypothetical protein
MTDRTKKPLKKSAPKKDGPKKRERSVGLPTREHFLEFVSSATGTIGKR